MWLKSKKKSIRYKGIDAIQSRYNHTIILFEDGDVVAKIPCEGIKTKRELKKCVKAYCR